MHDALRLDGVVNSIAGTWFADDDVNGDGLLSRDWFVGLWTVSVHQTPESANATFEHFTASQADAGPGPRQPARNSYQGIIRDFFTGEDPDAPSSWTLGKLSGPDL